MHASRPKTVTDAFLAWLLGEVPATHDGRRRSLSRVVRQTTGTSRVPTDVTEALLATASAIFWPESGMQIQATTGPLSATAQQALLRRSGSRATIVDWALEF